MSVKIVRSRRPRVSITVPLRGGYRVEFEGGRAVVPDDIAAHLCGQPGGFYISGSDVSEALVPGASVLIIRDTGMGDILMMTPLIRKLARDKGCRVDVLTHQRYRCLFDGNPFVRETFALENDTTDRSSYDVVFDLRLVVENAEAAGAYRHRADAFAEQADIQLLPDERRPDLFLSGSERDAAEADIAGLRDIGPVIAYVWRASASNRSWSPETHATMLAALADAGYSVAVLDHERQEMPVPDSPNILNLTGAFDVRRAAAILAACDAAVTPDTGLFHVAAAVGTSCVAYFGAFPAAERQAHVRLNVLSAPENCARMPCRSYRCLNRDEFGQARCLAISPVTVLQSLAALLGTAAPESTAETDAPVDPSQACSHDGSHDGSHDHARMDDDGAPPRD